MIFHFLAHLHPLIIHLPIGVLILALVLEGMSRWMGQVQLRPAISVALAIGAITSVFSSLSGWMLSRQGDFDLNVVQWHQWSGLATTLLAALLWRFQSARAYFPLFVCTILAVVITGHFGGTLTHGAGYLFEKQEEQALNVSRDVSPDSTVFSSRIAPILISRCGTCHKPDKHKGDLVLISAEGIRTGGKHGAILVDGQPDSSEMIRRIHLPPGDEHRMPPKGKTQLSENEISQLEWWIASGAGFTGLNKDFPLPVKLKSMHAQEPGLLQNPVFKLQVNAPAPAVIQQLKDSGVHVEAIAEGQPWLNVALIAVPLVTQDQWSLLQKIRENIVELNLSHSVIRDEDWSKLNFPNLIQLNLAGINTLKQTNFLTGMPYLEQLNLTGTGVSANLESELATLKQLKRIHLWQTPIDSSIIKKWQKIWPAVGFNTGAVIPDNEPLTLRPPNMLYAKSFFDDTMHIDLNFPFKNVDIYYSLDEAASPTTQSPKFDKTIVLDKTSHLRAFAAKDGWNNSPVIDAVFVRNKFKIKEISIKSPPSKKYPAHGALSLIDGKTSDVSGADTWLGYEGEHLEATLDMGSEQTVKSLFVHCLENNGSWIFVPKGIEVSTSSDGVHYRQNGFVTFPVNQKMGAQLPHLLECPLHATTQARYIRVKVISLLKNPSWHPGKGQKCWIFVDEITVN